MAKCTRTDASTSTFKDITWATSCSSSSSALKATYKDSTSLKFTDLDKKECVTKDGYKSFAVDKDGTIKATSTTDYTATCKDKDNTKYGLKVPISTGTYDFSGAAYETFATSA